MALLGFFDKIHGFNIAEIEEWIISKKHLFRTPNFDEDKFINALININEERKSRIAKIELICNNKPDYPAPPKASFDMLSDVGLNNEKFNCDVDSPDFFKIFALS